MSEKPEGRPLDPVAVREAIERLRVAFGASRSPDTFVVVSLATEDARAALLADIGLCLAALDEGREASAPFVALPPAWVNDDEEISRWPKAKDLRRLAAWNEALTEETTNVR